MTGRRCRDAEDAEEREAWFFPGQVRRDRLLGACAPGRGGNNEEYVFPSHYKFCAWLANQKDIIWLDYWAKKEA